MTYSVCRRTRSVNRRFRLRLIDEHVDDAGYFPDVDGADNSQQFIIVYNKFPLPPTKMLGWVGA